MARLLSSFRHRQPTLTAGVALSYFHPEHREGPAFRPLVAASLPRHPFPLLISPTPISPAPSPAGSRPAATHPSSPPTSPARQGRACPPQEGKISQLHLMLHPHIRLPATGGSPTPSPTRWTAPPPPPIPAR